MRVGETGRNCRLRRPCIAKQTKWFAGPQAKHMMVQTTAGLKMNTNTPELVSAHGCLDAVLSKFCAPRVFNLGADNFKAGIMALDGGV